jgi:hypothetical protein
VLLIAITTVLNSKPTSSQYAGAKLEFANRGVPVEKFID